MLAPPTSTASSYGLSPPCLTTRWYRLHLRLAAAELDHALDQLRHGMIGELQRVLPRRMALGRGQDDVGEPAHAGPPVDKRQSDARTEAERHEHVGRACRGGKLAH